MFIFFNFSFFYSNENENQNEIGEPDCNDASDEENCLSTTLLECPEGEFRCGGNFNHIAAPGSRCILNRFRCDGNLKTNESNIESNSGTFFYKSDAHHCGTSTNFVLSSLKQCFTLFCCCRREAQKRTCTIVVDRMEFVKKRLKIFALSHDLFFSFFIFWFSGESDCPGNYKRPC